MATTVTAGPVDVPRARTGRRAPTWASALTWAAPGAMIGVLVAIAVHRGLIDDAYITLGYVRNMATDLHWGLIPTETSNTATSPLNIMLLTVATWLAAPFTGGVRPVVGLSLLTVVLCAALTLWVAQVCRRIGVSPAWSVAVLVTVLANPFVNSAIGLEVLPTAALLAGLLAAAVSGRRMAFGLVGGALALTRLDLVVIVAVVFLLTPAVRRRPWVAPAVATVVALPWFVVSWAALGSAIPTSFVIKTLQKSFGAETFFNGPWTLWLTHGVLPFLLAVVPAGLGALTALALAAAGVRRRLPAQLWPLVGLALGGVAYYAAYSLLQVPPYQWYYVPTTTAMGIVGTLGLALATRRARTRVRHLFPALVAVALVVLTGFTLDGRSLPWPYPVYFGSWALPSEYRTVGAAVGQVIGDETVVAPPEIGTLAFACDCSMVDAFSDPGRTEPLVQQRIDQAGPVGRALLRANFARLDRSEQPRPAQWQLVWTQGPVPAGVRSWPTNSPATGPATLYLERLAGDGQ